MSSDGMLLSALGWARRKLHQFERMLDQVKLDLVARRKIVTFEDLEREMSRAGYTMKVDSERPPPDLASGSWISAPSSDARVREITILPPPMEFCDECGAAIPDEAGGSLMNEHHDPTCSLFEDHIDSNSGV